MMNKDEAAIFMMCAPWRSDREYNPISFKSYDHIARHLFIHKLSPGHLFSMSLSELTDLLSTVKIRGYKLEDLVARIYHRLLPIDELERYLEKRHEQGISVVTRATPGYPPFFRKQLGADCPSYLYYVGNLKLIGLEGLAIVGSRNLDEDPTAKCFTERLVEKAVGEGFVICSGGAKGIDSIAERTALRLKGYCAIALADSFYKHVQSPEAQEAIEAQRALYITTNEPFSTAFSTYKAMERNKYIYGASTKAVVVTAGEKSGSVEGAKECLRKGIVPLFVRQGTRGTAPGNRLLLDMDAYPLDEIKLDNASVRELLTV